MCSKPFDCFFRIALCGFSEHLGNQRVVTIKRCDQRSENAPRRKIYRPLYPLLARLLFGHFRQGNNEVRFLVEVNEVVDQHIREIAALLSLEMNANALGVVEKGNSAFVSIEFPGNPTAPSWWWQVCAYRERRKGAELFLDERTHEAYPFRNGVFHRLLLLGMYVGLS